MTWFLVDDDLPSRQSVLSIPRAHRKSAIGAWTLCGAWCSKNGTDGFVPAYMLEELACDETDAAWLVKAGIWAEADGGWQFVVWAPEQLTAAEVRERKEKRAAAGRKGGRASGQTRRSGSSSEASASASAQADAEASASPLLEQDASDREANLNPSPSPSPKPKPIDLLTFVSRLTSSDAHATTTDAESAYWKTLAGQADLADEARAFLAYNAHTDIRDWRGAWHGWLRKASERAGPPPALPPGCARCLDGWLPDDDDGHPRPCPTCKPHAAPSLRAVTA